MTEYITFKSVCSICGDVYGSKQTEMVFKDPHDPRLKALRKRGFIESHGYCPICFKQAQQELRMVVRKAINTYA